MIFALDLVWLYRRGVSGWIVEGFNRKGEGCAWLAPDQYGRVRWVAGGAAAGRLGTFQRAADYARRKVEPEAGRFGTRGSEKRGRLCEAMCNWLNDGEAA